jgi:phytochromobilin:ferredoxin oxidoreductase
MYVNLIEKMQLLPWGGKITSESLKFFSPIVIWTTIASSHLVHDLLFLAFVDYHKVRILFQFYACHFTFLLELNINKKNFVHIDL